MIPPRQTGQEETRNRIQTQRPERVTRLLLKRFKSCATRERKCLNALLVYEETKEWRAHRERYLCVCALLIDLIVYPLCVCVCVSWKEAYIDENNTRFSLGPLLLMLDLIDVQMKLYSAAQRLVSFFSFIRSRFSSALGRPDQKTRRMETDWCSTIRFAAFPSSSPPLPFFSYLWFGKNISIVLKSLLLCSPRQWMASTLSDETPPHKIPFQNNQLSCRESRMPSKESKNVPYQRAAAPSPRWCAGGGQSYDDDDEGLDHPVIL